MRKITTIEELRSELDAERADAREIALVPTMGNLHDGHIALVAAAKRLAETCVVSLFVNPAQFGPNEDFDRYPRTPEADLQRLQRAGADFVFTPGDDAMYPEGRLVQTNVHVPFLSGFLCGAARPGHFDGVATVVLKLLNIVSPLVAIFGEKDYQQLTLIRTLVKHLNVPVGIVGVPTVRAPDGLALSSRNQYLSEAERAVAPALYRTLLSVRDGLIGGRRDFAALEQEGLRALREAGFRPDYIAVRNAHTLRLPDPGDRALRVLGAAHLGKARLIDNTGVELPA